MARSADNSARLLHGGLGAAVFIVFALHAWLHLAVLRIPHPVTQDEPSFVDLMRAGNAYSLAGATSVANVYGPVYPSYARVFGTFVANPYIALRLANSAALAVQLAVLGLVLLRRRTPALAIAALLAIVYALDVGSQSLAGSADLTAAALYIAALATAESKRPWYDVTSVAAAILAGLAKPYAFLAWGIIASHRLLFAPRRATIRFLTISLALGGIALLCLRHWAPWYFVSTFEVHGHAVERSGSVLLRQTLAFAGLAGGLLALVALWRPENPSPSESGDAALPRRPSWDLWTWAAVAAAAALLGILGWHGGNFLVYYDHLLLGPLVIVAARSLPRWPRAGLALLGLNLVAIGAQIPPRPGSDNWDSLAAEVASTRGRILADPLLAPLAAGHPQFELFERGHTATLLDLFERAPAAAQSHAALANPLEGNAALLQARLERGEFDAVFIAHESTPGGDTWCYHRGRFLPAIFRHYVATTELTIFPYYAAYWDRSRYGRQGVVVTKWIHKP